MKSRLLNGMAALTTAALIAGCGGGGGGGSGGTNAYTISLSSDKTILPLNVGHEIANIGSGYTTTVYVQARASNGNPIPDDTEVFSCSLTAGLDSGALYYLDGDEDHYTEVENPDGTTTLYPNAYRSITLGSNAGSASFHFHSTDIAGTATIRCSVQSPDNVNRSTSIDIQVGGAPSGKVSQIAFTPFSPNYLFVQGMNGTTQVQGQLWLVDEAGQRIANPTNGVNNVEVNIWNDPSSTTEDNATLRGVDATGKAVADKSIKVASINGQAQFTLVSGSTAGTITLEAVSDRADNNVDNGITERVSNLYTIYVLDEAPGGGTAADPLVITTTALPAAKDDVPYGAVLEAEGGYMPYTWSLVSGSRLPYGLALAATGVITGTPIDSTSGTFTFVVKLTDASGATVYKGFSIAYTANPVIPVESAPTVSTNSIASCTVGASCVRTVSASGGETPYTWSAFGLPAGLTIDDATGVISGTPTSAGIYQVALVAEGDNGLSSTPKVLELTVWPTAGTLTVMNLTLPDGKVGSTYSFTLTAAGGTPAYTWNVSNLPAGLSYNASTGVISGIPTVSGTPTVVVQVTDSLAASDTNNIPLKITP